MERSAGILLPVFSLPWPYGIGSLGREARAFAEFLHNAGQRWWQVLPVGPTGAGNSPYTSESTFAGNPLLIDLEDLRDRGLLTEAELSAARVPEGAPIDYAALYESREALLRRAFSRLSGREALSNRGVGAEEAPPQARTKLTRAGIQTAGKTADRPHNGTAGVSSRVTSVAGADGFSVKPTTKLEASNRFRFHTAAQRWAAGMEAETPPPDRQRQSSYPVVAGTGARRIVCAAPDKLFLLELGRGRGHRDHGL